METTLNGNREGWQKRIWSFLSHNWVVGIVLFALGSQVTVLKSKVVNTSDKVDIIEARLSRVMSYFENSIKDGPTVKVGINNVGISQNGIAVFSDNSLALKEGDRVYLKNHLDPRWETYQKFLVQVVIPRNSDKSQAEMFITLEGAKRMGVDIYKGVFPLRVVRMQDDGSGITAAKSTGK